MKHIKIIILLILANFLFTTIGICASADNHETAETHCIAHCITECCDVQLNNQEMELLLIVTFFINPEFTLTETLIVFEIDQPPEHIS